MVLPNTIFFADDHLLLHIAESPYFLHSLQYATLSLPNTPTMGHASIATPMAVDGNVDNIDDSDVSSSLSLDTHLINLLEPLQNYEFPSYFTTGRCGSALCMFHSNGIYSLLVNGDEIKVCICL